ncbi:hypothetical protein FDI69_gp029 [Rhodococcus phage Trina]|uniref:Uncharacterized protein n=1 Tax=Rhodococcus phage Trina TaxID=2027905 RepID=A0A2D1A3X2_9CAUD|nr:hypothetical protein FDI69_gp029 [Rhodococcus phage Trina]ASZ74846.1 hypothetical protein SEA_TRINA_29 [Rhodococcus phage Trina]
MIYNLLGLLAFLAVCFAMGFGLNYLMHRIALWRGWYTEPLKPSRTITAIEKVIDRLEE